MGSLNPDIENKVAEILDATHFTQHGFTVKYDDAKNPLWIITFSANPEYEFAINSDANGFITRECPGIHSDMPEKFLRSNTEQCLDALREWTERIIDRQRDWMMDEFGGVADRSPSY